MCQSCYNTVPHTGWLKQLKLTFSQFCIQDQAVGRVSSFRAPSHWLVDDLFLLDLGPLYDLPSQDVCVQISSSKKDTDHIGLGPSHMTLSYLNHLSLQPYLQTQSHCGTLGGR
jgi:hypothetical protein